MSALTKEDLQNAMDKCKELQLPRIVVSKAVPFDCAMVFCGEAHFPLAMRDVLEHTGVIKNIGRCDGLCADAGEKGC